MHNLRSGKDEPVARVQALVCIHTNKGETRDGQLRYTRHTLDGKEVTDEIKYDGLLHPTEVEVFRRKPVALYDDFDRQARVDRENEAALALAQSKYALEIIKDALTRTLLESGVSQERAFELACRVDENVITVTNERKAAAAAARAARDVAKKNPQQ